MVDLLSPQRKQPIMRDEGGQIILSNVTEVKITKQDDLL